MIGLSGFNRKPRQYNHIPLYYDPAKEAREERERRITGETDTDYVPGKYIHNQRRNRMLGIDRPQTSSVDKRRFLIRAMIFLCLLGMLTYVILRLDIVLMLVDRLR